MSYSIDLRLKVIDFINSGGKKTDAARIFGINRITIYNWLKNADSIEFKKAGPKKPYKTNRDLLSKHLSKSPDKTITELAKALGVSRNAVWYNLKIMKITRKKNVVLHSKKFAKKKKVP